MTAWSNELNAALVARAEDLDWFETMLGEQMAFRVRSGDVGGAFAIVEAHVPPFTGPPLHHHKEREESFEVLEGTFRFHCAGEEFDAGPGTSVVIPRNKVHAWVNVGSRPARLLFTFVPGGIDEFFPMIGTNSPEALLALGQQHDVWIDGPPLQVNRKQDAQ